MRNSYTQVWDYNSYLRIPNVKISLIVSALLVGTTLLHASPNNGTVMSGSATITQNGTITNINQSTQKASINWSTFSIGSNETVNFNQPNVSSITLNRVVGNEKSVIDGALNANGQVWILNSNGVLFNKNASINTSGLLATTKSLSDADFQAGNYTFTGDSKANIINLGTMDIANSGYAALLANTVSNEGTIKAIKGTIELVGGDAFNINLNGNSLVNLTVTKGVLDALVENKGALIANGGEIYLTTNAVNDLLKGVVNNTGVIEAQTLDDVTGKIELYAHGGEVKVGGTITTGAGEGFVETSGQTFSIDPSASIITGSWLLDPVSITIDSTLASAIMSALGSGDVTISTDGGNTPSTSSGESGSAGDINVNFAITWSTAQKLTLSASNNIYINADITIQNVAGELTLYYGQGAPSANNLSDYILSGKIKTINGNSFTTTDAGNIVFTTGGKFTEKQGSDGVAVTSHFQDLAYITKQVISDVQGGGTSSDGIQKPITWTVIPSDTHMIVLQPTANYSINDIAALLNMSADSKAYINTTFSNRTTNYSVSYQDVVLTAGQTITMAWNYTATDYAPFNDGSFISFVNTSNSNDHTSSIYGVTTETMVLGATVSGTGNWSTKSYGSTGWQTVSFTAGQAGTYRIGYAVFNLDDTALSPFLVVDTKAGTVLKNGVTFEPLAVDPNGPLAQAGVTINTTPQTTTPQTTTTPSVISAIVNNTAVEQPRVVQTFTPQHTTNYAPPTTYVRGGESITLASTAGDENANTLVSLSEIRQMQRASGTPSGTTEQSTSGETTGVDASIRVPLSRGSLIDIVNGGVKLPENVEQEFYVLNQIQR